MKRKRNVAIGIVVFVVIVGLLGSGSDNNQKEGGSEPTMVESTKPQSEEDQIKAIVEEALAGQNNRDVEYLKSVEVTEVPEAGYKVEIGFNANDNFSNDLIKGDIESNMSELYIALFQSTHNINEVGIGASFPLIDQYGNESDSVVYYSVLTKEEAGKVNWQADESTLKLQILPDIWETVLLHPLFE